MVLPGEAWAEAVVKAGSFEMMTSIQACFRTRFEKSSDPAKVWSENLARGIAANGWQLAAQRIDSDRFNLLKWLQLLSGFPSELVIPDLITEAVDGGYLSFAKPALESILLAWQPHLVVWGLHLYFNLQHGQAIDDVSWILMPDCY